MKRVRIDFAPNGIRRALFHTSPVAWSIALLSAALVALASVVGWQYVDRFHRLEIEQQAAQARTRTVPVSKVESRQSPVSQGQADAINAAVLQLNLPWRALRDAVQEATPVDIALLALEPDAKKRIVRITAEARTSDDMIGYVERMKKQDWFDGVVLVRHEINEQDPNRPIRFQLDAQWGGQP
jgi:Tfp pilus assembly protein PilN